ncbi:MAG: hypothetical protein A2846_04725 [Candidatus Doudnabacteria bacterium RIFCSPHIGHO2_01_FULL_49_9]|uniref:Endonuclease/exonuclease/phosphatase domain-containing protein n=1 Tax=Candidatus Doudnabacteria bacterium RIFCSPHIGHO2_01_FULL_49_9 TaxID=1817827 RepID=A0A1F5P1Q2_9BACT|nr:MAG: hypothetical protein A2846_04725 [Candidatus Doudnabacteria bacterium RIFCSPHIGHO2_01_FULL_49_9]
MKLVSLNIWGGMRFEALMEFVKAQAADTDIFCFQEVFSTPSDKTSSGTKRVSRVNMFQELEKALPGFKSFFAPTQEGWTLDGFVDFPVFWGLAAFVRKTHTVQDTGEFYVYGHYNGRTIERDDPQYMGRNVQYLQLSNQGRQITVCNLHGYWVRAAKTDTPERIIQSEKIAEFVASREGDTIVCGDFNLQPETESMKILESKMRNLIKEFEIKTTRSELYADLKVFNDHFADYVLVSPGVKVLDFQVPYILASDHLPMILRFD